MAKVNLIEIDEMDFLLMLKEVGFTKSILMNLIGCSSMSFYQWEKNHKYPYYVFLLLTYSKKYFQIKTRKNSNNLEDDFKIQHLKKENEKLEEEIKKYEKLKDLFKETFGFDL